MSLISMAMYFSFNWATIAEALTAGRGSRDVDITLSTMQKWWVKHLNYGKESKKKVERNSTCEHVMKTTNFNREPDICKPCSLCMYKLCKMADNGGWNQSVVTVNQEMGCVILPLTFNWLWGIHDVKNCVSCCTCKHMQQVNWNPLYTNMCTM